jgi:2-polyprenyl-3-methyl-5-hydroxy-6-metoxy-1,4-benzoquinol methylase
LTHRIANPYIRLIMPEARPNAPLRRRSLSYVACDHCGCEVTRSVHNVSRLVQCIECGLIFVNPRPEFDDLAPQYEAEYFHCAHPTFGGYEDYEGDRNDVFETFAKRIASLKSLIPAARPKALDVGCATGIFLEAATQAGWDVEGIDISSYAVSQAQEKGMRARVGELSAAQFPENSFDVVTLWDIIEHVTEPSSVLVECERILVPGGLLAISTPDAGSPPAKILGGNWLGFRSIDEHLYFFSRASLGAMLEKANFEIVRSTSVGKYISLSRIIARLRYYTRVGAWLLGSVDRLMPHHSIYLDPSDTMMIVARKKTPLTRAK